MKAGSPLGGVDKALCILQKLAESGPAGTGLTRLAADLGMNKASVHRALQALRYRDFAQQESSGNYRLGGSALQIADCYLRDRNLRNIFHTSLVELCGRLREICHLGVLMDENVVYIDKVEPARPIDTWSKVGWSNPAVTTALGRSMMCQRFVDFESFAQCFPSPIARRTALTRGTLQAVWQELVEARQRGFAMEEEEYGLGVSCLSIAILRGSRAIAAISVTGPSERINLRRGPQLVAMIHQCITPHLPPGLSLQRPLTRSGRRRKAPVALARVS